MLARLGHALGAREQLADGAAVADDPVVAELDIPLVEQVTQAESGALVLDGAPRDGQQLIDLERLLQVVAGPELHGFDGALDAAVGGHDHHGRPLAFGGRPDGLADDVQPRLFGHQVVDDQEIEGALGQQT